MEPAKPSDRPAASESVDVANLDSLSTPKQLGALQCHVEDLALQNGLSFFPVVFEMKSARELSIVAARDGFPVRYPHWRFGDEFQRLWKGYDFGSQKIYELVINTDPVVAYLLDSNSLVEQKLVMAHVYGHADFFKNNRFFKYTNRKMLEQMALHAAEVSAMMQVYGREEVEQWIDACRSIDNLIGSYPAAIGALAPQHQNAADGLSGPARPERDVMAFLIRHAEVSDWQRRALEIVRAETYYFLPQIQTKIMNEGWASYWHTRLMEQYLVNAGEVVHYCMTHSGAVAMQPGQLNPYKLGLELWHDIEERWDKGRFGADYEECRDIGQKLRWNTSAGLGRSKIFEVRASRSDLTFIEEFFTFEFARKHAYVPESDDQGNALSFREQIEIFDATKANLLRALTNCGQPQILLVEANYRGQGELLLRHEHEGQDLDLAKARATLENLYRIWNKPVNLETIVNGNKIELRCDGINKS